MVRRLLFLSFGVAALAAAGCGPLLDATVTGEVTLDGVALTQGEVVFHPIDKRRGQQASSPIRANGTYSLFTTEMEGALNGEYKVTVVGSNALPATADTPVRKATLVTPLRYSLLLQTPLRFRIKNGPNKVPLQLRSHEPTSKLPHERPPEGEEA